MAEQPFLPKTTTLAESSHSQSRSRSRSPSVTIDFLETIIPTNSSYINLITNFNKRSLLHRSHSSPSIITYDKEPLIGPKLPKSNPFIVRQACFGLILYLATGVIVFIVSGSFKGVETVKPVDAVYFLVVTLCTIGYGDIVPDTTFTKLFTCAFILFGFGFVYILLNGVVSYICDRQEAVLLTAVDESRINTMVQGRSNGLGLSWAGHVRTYMMDMEKGRMRIRIKVCLALGVVFFCLAIGTVGIHLIEELSWVDSFYMAVTSVTTVGYGDYSFTTLSGRCFAIVWLLVSCLAVARAFLYLTELGIEKRNRTIRNWVLQKKMTLGDLAAADLDKDGSISKAEFVIYKLKEMGKIADKDIIQIGHQFDALDNANCGKISLVDLREDDE